MASKKEESPEDNGEPTKGKGKKRTYLSQSEVPSITLTEALRVPRAIYDNYGGDPTTPLNVAAAMEMTPTSGTFRGLTGAAIAYGLTEGGSAAPLISLTSVGHRAVAPTEEGDDLQARRQAFRQPRVVNDFLTKYDGKPFPPDQIAKKVLEEMGVPREATDRTLKLVREGAQQLGMITDIKSKLFVQIVGGGISPIRTEDSQEASVEVSVQDVEAKRDPPLTSPMPGQSHSSSSAETPTTTKTKPIFIGHGKNKEPLGKVQEVLRSFGIPALVAEEQPNLARPIPDKVREVMEQCGSAILIFTKDELLFDKVDEEFKEIWRPSENVVHELGAASYAYGNKIVIMREEGLRLASNFESIGRINFESNNIEAKATELLKELIGFGLVKITPAQ